MTRPIAAPRATRPVQLPGMTAGGLTSRTSGAQRVVTGRNSPEDIDQRRQDQDARGSVTPPGRRRSFRSMGSAAGDRVEINSAVTVHSPGSSPYTRLVTDTGPLPGTTPRICSSRTNASAGPGFPRTSSR